MPVKEVTVFPKGAFSITLDILKLIDKRNQIHFRATACNLPENWSSFRQMRNRVAADRRDRVQKYDSKSDKHISDQCSLGIKKWWRLVKSRGIKKWWRLVKSRGITKWWRLVKSRGIKKWWRLVKSRGIKKWWRLVKSRGIKKWWRLVKSRGIKKWWRLVKSRGIKKWWRLVKSRGIKKWWRLVKSRVDKKGLRVDGIPRNLFKGKIQKSNHKKPTFLVDLTQFLFQLIR